VVRNRENKTGAYRSLCAVTCCRARIFSSAKNTPLREIAISGPNVASMRRLNHLHAKMRVVIENAFGSLKGRWNVLRFLSAHPMLAAAVSEANVALHNVLESRDAAYDNEWEEAGEKDTDGVVRIQSDDALHTVGVARRVGLVKALGMVWIDGA